GEPSAREASLLGAAGLQIPSSLAVTDLVRTAIRLAVARDEAHERGRVIGHLARAHETRLTIAADPSFVFAGLTFSRSAAGQKRSETDDDEQAALPHGVNGRRTHLGVLWHVCRHPARRE